MMIWPVSPADFLCMLAALTKMTFKRYMIIIILTKPFTLVVYTYGLTYIIDFFLADVLRIENSLILNILWYGNHANFSIVNRGTYLAFPP